MLMLRVKMGVVMSEVGRELAIGLKGWVTCLVCFKEPCLAANALPYKNPKYSLAPKPFDAK